MKRHKRFSMLDWLRPGMRQAKPGPADAGMGLAAPGVSVHAKLDGAALEQAYRDLLLEVQILAESNERLHERLARREQGLEESPAAKKLIHAQRSALAERSRRLRALEYENKQLKRQQAKLVEENRRLAASLARHMEDIQPLLRQEETSRRELADAKTALREKTTELLRLTDKYYQLEARTKPQPAPSSAANSRY